MTSGRARIVRSSDVVGAAPLFPSGEQGMRRRIAREELEARLLAERILDEAHAAADGIVRTARDQAAAATAAAEREGSESAEAKFAARWLALRSEEGKRLERDRERLVRVAVVLAERLLGAELQLDPARIAEFARTAIAEARGARRVVIQAHPADADLLRSHLDSLGGHSQAVDVREEPALARGDLRLQTDIGTIDAKLVPRLERLAAALRDALT